MDRGYACDYKKQINEEMLDADVTEIITKLVSNPKFANLMKAKINMEVDTTAIEQELKVCQKEYRRLLSLKTKIIDEIDNLDPDDKHYNQRKSDLDNRLYKNYDKLAEIEESLQVIIEKKKTIDADKMTADKIYSILIDFDRLYKFMKPAEKRQLMELLISEIQVYPGKQANGQWLKSIKFKLPIIDADTDICLDSEQHVECVIKMSKE